MPEDKNAEHAVPGLDADVYFGDAERPLPDWRKHLPDEDDDDTPQPGVAAMLGFDPSELEEDEIPTETDQFIKDKT